MVNCIINFASTCIIQVKLNNLIKSIIQTIVYWNDSIFACLSLYFAISTIVVTSATKTFSHRMRMWFCWSLTTFALQIRIHLINVDQKQRFVSIDIQYIELCVVLNVASFIKCSNILNLTALVWWGRNWWNYFGASSFWYIYDLLLELQFQCIRHS